MTNKYVLIYQTLAEEIKNGTMKPKTLLPSEHELAERFETSRETIRKALNMLSQNGYIQKIRGKGSLVIDLSKFDFPVSGLISFKELAKKMDKPPKTSVEELSLIKADSALRQLLPATSKDSVWKVVRTRKIGGESVILDKDFILKKYVPKLTEDICADSIYEYLEKDLGLVISFAKKEIIVEEPTDEDRELLDLDGFHNVVVIKSLVYLEDASLFQYTESRHRPDKFRFVDFARRNQA